MRLKYRDNQTFRIVQLTDLHIGAKLYVEKDQETFQLIDDAFTYLDADLFVLTGDIIWSDGVEDSEIIFLDVIEKLNQFDIPVVLTYGNHDAEDKLMQGDLCQLEAGLKNAGLKHNSFIVRDKEAYNV